MNSGHQNTIKHILQQAQQKIDALDAELLIAHILDKSREWVLAHPEAKIKRLKDYKIKRLLARRAKGEPIAYLTGHKEFFGLDFVVNKDVLIPRPETELLVECVIERLKTYDIGRRTILIDVGTGSGCIPIAIAKTIKQYDNITIQAVGIDISRKALQTAKINARKNKISIKFLHGDLLSPIHRSYVLSPTSSLIITANLPYLTAKQYKSSPSIQHEPKTALVAGPDGLKYYKKLLTQIRQLFCNLQSEICIFSEIDPSQSRPITSLIKSILPQAQIEIKKDLAGLDRVVKIKLLSNE